MLSPKIVWSTGLISAGLSFFLMVSAGAESGSAAPVVTAALVASPGTSLSAPVQPATPMQLSLLQQMQDAFTGIAKSAEPFVVNITASHSLTLDADPDAVPDDGVPPQPAPKVPGAPNTPEAPLPFPKQEEATGSGLIVRSDGYVLTNDHVVEGSPYVTVTLSDGREFRGKVTPDFKSDLALVKIDPGSAQLPVAQFADSDAVQPGQWAIAIGSPFDLQNTMTVGVISATHRHQTIGDDPDDSRYYPDLMQTDAAINPGNSGGPLLNIDGNVVGVNVAIESPVEGSAGVGFAIPSKTALYVMGQLINYGKVVRGYLGLAPADLTPLHAQQYGVKTGAWIEQVDKDSPAGHAGIHATDIVTSFANKPIDGELSLRDAIAATIPGQTVPVVVFRNNKSLTVSVTVASPPATETDNAPVQPGAPKVGVTFRALTASDRQELSFSTDVAGVIVTSVAPNSPADEAGLEQNDVIEKIDRDPVSTVPQVSDALGALQLGDTPTIVVLRSTDGSIEEIACDLRI
jgi:serine protease Do